MPRVRSSGSSCRATRRRPGQDVRVELFRRLPPDGGRRHHPCRVKALACDAVGAHPAGGEAGTTQRVTTIERQSRPTRGGIDGRSGLTPVADRSALDPVAAEVDQVARELGVDPARGSRPQEARVPAGVARSRTGWPPARRSRAGGPSCVSTRTSCRSSSWSRPSSTRSSPATPAPPSCWPGSPSSTP